MKKFALPFLFLALLFVMMNSSFAESTNGWVEVTAGSSPFVYSDELLMVDEHILDPDVAKMSAALAAAAYSSSTTRSMLSQMGFTTIESFYGANFSLTDNDRVYYTIAQKRYGDYTIYCIPIRGTQHAMEWVSNFNMGPTNGYHTGFKAASDDVWNNLMSMINSDGSSSDKRIIWVTGHSRGAAVANILAGRLTSAGKGHVFGYTFACPNVYYGSAPAYSNIYNFNFANDVVPQVPLTSWGYTRYGRDGTKDISSWASDMMPKAEMDALISALGTLSPGSNESKLVFGLLSWAMIDGDASSLRTLLSDFTDDPDGLIFLITNGYGLGDDTAYFRADYLNMLTFWKENQQTMSEIAAEDWMAYRSSDENAAVFALYDTVAGGTVTSYAQLESLIPTIRERNTAANDLVSVSDVMDVLFDANWSLKGLIKNPFKAHSSSYYTQWMNQDYFGYRGRAGRTYENTEIQINARTISPQCFDGTSGNFTVNIENVDAIASKAFQNCSGLTAVVIDGSQDYIGYMAFSYCSTLKTITLPADYDMNNAQFYGSGVETIIYTAGRTGVMIDRTEDIWNKTPEYYARDSLQHLVFNEGITHIADKLCFHHSGLDQFYCKKLESITFPSSLVSIGVRSFRGCDSLRFLDLPDGLTSLGEGSFSRCSSLSAVDIPKGLTEIPTGAFTSCDSLMSVTIPDGVTSIGQSAFSGCSSLVSIVIPDSVTNIGAGAFQSSGLISVTIPEGVTDIDSYTFAYCSALSSITIPDSVTVISNEAFSECTALASVTIPNSVTSIHNYAFEGCSGLTSIALPHSITYIRPGVFSGCSSLLSVFVPSSVTTISGEAFENCHVDLVLFVYNLSYAHTWCKEREVAFEIIDAPNEFCHYRINNGNVTITGCTGTATTIEIPAEIEGFPVTEIQWEAFRNHKEIESITIPNGVATIGDQAFYGCSGLQSVNIPNGVTTIHASTFSGCSSLSSITIPKSVTSIGNYAFYGCSSLTSITIPDSVISIDRYAFRYCAQLADITFMHTSDSVLTIADGAFQVKTQTETIVRVHDTSDINLIIDEYVWSDNNRNVVYAPIPNAPLNIILDAEAISINASITLGVKNLPADTSTDVLVWSVDDETVAQITQEGVLTFSRAGYVTVYVAVADTDLQAELTVECEGTAIIKLPETLTLVEQEAFMGVAAEIAIIPASVQHVESRAFANCPNLYKVVVQNPDTVIADDAFDGSTYATVLVGEEKTE